MVSMWTQHGFHMDTMCYSGGYHMVSNVDENHMVSMWKPCGVYVKTMWCPCANHVMSTFESMWCSPGKYIVFTRKPHGIHVETMWCPCGNHEVST